MYEIIIDKSLYSLDLKYSNMCTLNEKNINDNTLRIMRGKTQKEKIYFGESPTYNWELLVFCCCWRRQIVWKPFDINVTVGHLLTE